MPGWIKLVGRNPPPQPARMPMPRMATADNTSRDRPVREPIRLRPIKQQNRLARDIGIIEVSMYPFPRGFGRAGNAVLAD